MSNCKLQYDVLEVAKGVSYGSVALKSLQNESIPELDLLVREAVQNSSDASLSTNSKRFRVEFNTGFFNQKKFNSYMTGITEMLDQSYSDKKYKYLEIRDSRTCGLTGPVKLNGCKGKHGNFYKLVFDTGKKQEQAEAGGNWGFGKSVYFRVGIGLVIFYTQIENEEGKEESRLIISIVEDEDKHDAESLLFPICTYSAGKAWWGIKDGKDLLPVTDTEWIEEFLSVFKNINPFKPGQRGTSIIIPYIDQKKLLSDIIPAESDDDNSELKISKDVRQSFTSQFGSELDAYIRLAVQKWYAPRINNSTLSKLLPDRKMMNISINHEQIARDKMIPVFSVVQDLYNLALAKVYGVELKDDNGNKMKLPFENRAKCKIINIQGDFEHKNIGCVAFAKVDRGELMRANALSPYNYIGAFGKSDDFNGPIVLYAREPGMVIEYAVSGKWAANLPCPENTNEIVIAFFVPCTNQKFKSHVKDFRDKTLGDYLRACEASAHLSWEDKAKYNIISRIQGHVSAAIKDYVIAADHPAVPATASRLSTKLGHLLMPQIGSRPGRGSGGGAGGGGGGGLGKQLSFKVISQTINDDGLEIAFQLKLLGARKQCQMFIAIDSESGQLDQSSWTKNIETMYPARIAKCQISNIHSDVHESDGLVCECNEEHGIYSDEVIDIKLVSTCDDGICSGLCIDTHILHAEMDGVITLKATDRKFRYSLVVK